MEYKQRTVHKRVETNNNLRDDLIEIARTLDIGLKASNIKSTFLVYLEHTGSSWLDFMSRTILFPICILSFLFSSFGFDFSAALLRNRKPSKQQQHITNHVPFGEWYRTKWLYTRSLTTYIHTSRSTIYGAKFILSKWLKFRMKRTMEISFRKAS